MSKRTRYWLIAISILMVLVALWRLHVRYQYRHTSGEVVTTGLSSDAHYAITADSKNYIILWNLKQHTKRIISRNGNMYSAYWVKGTPYYLWQSLKDFKVRVINVNTNQLVKVIQPGTLAYGQALSPNLKNYMYSDRDYNVYLLRGHLRHQLVKMYADSTFDGANKIINFTFVDNDHAIASAMSSYFDNPPRWGVMLFDLKKLKVIRQYLANELKTFATISPNGKYVVSGDDQSLQAVWKLESGKRLFRVVGSWPVIHETKHGFKLDKNVIAPPKDFYNNYNIMAIRYIDQNHYLVFTQTSRYAILYQTTHPKPIKYLKLGGEVELNTDLPTFDEGIDTSPSAHILVMSRFKSGIIVFRYDPKTQTIKRLWVGQ